MVCFILQSPPHIDGEPVSSITPGSCPSYHSQQSKSDQGHPQHRVAHIPPQTVREVSPFKALKQQNKLQPAACQQMLRSKQNEYVNYQMAWKSMLTCILSHQYEPTVIWAVSRSLMGKTQKREKNTLYAHFLLCWKVICLHHQAKLAETNYQMLCSLFPLLFVSILKYSPPFSLTSAPSFPMTEHNKAICK